MRRLEGSGTLQELVCEWRPGRRLPVVSSVPLKVLVGSVTGFLTGVVDY